MPVLLPSGLLLMAWDRVVGNKGARSAGVDGMTATFVRDKVGTERFLAELLDRPHFTNRGGASFASSLLNSEWAGGWIGPWGELGKVRRSPLTHRFPVSGAKL
jgi:hypothetical protein